MFNDVCHGQRCAILQGQLPVEPEEDQQHADAAVELRAYSCKSVQLLRSKDP